MNHCYHAYALATREAMCAFTASRALARASSALAAHAQGHSMHVAHGISSGGGAGTGDVQVVASVWRFT